MEVSLLKCSQMLMHMARREESMRQRTWDPTVGVDIDEGGFLHVVEFERFDEIRDLQFLKYDNDLDKMWCQFLIITCHMTLLTFHGFGPGANSHISKQD